MKTSRRTIKIRLGWFNSGTDTGKIDREEFTSKDSKKCFWPVSKDGKLEDSWNLSRTKRTIPSTNKHVRRLKKSWQEKKKLRTFEGLKYKSTWSEKQSSSDFSIWWKLLFGSKGLRAITRKRKLYLSTWSTEQVRKPFRLLSERKLSRYLKKLKFLKS